MPCTPWLKARLAAAIAAEGFAWWDSRAGQGMTAVAMIDIAAMSASDFVRFPAASAVAPIEHSGLRSCPTQARGCC